jgi:hypothetical protein
MRTTLVTATVLSGILLLACAKKVVDTGPFTEENGTLPDGGGETKTPPKDAGGTSSPTGKDSGAKKPAPADPGDDPGTGTGQCAAEATFGDCVDCCATAHPDGSDTFYGTYIQCLCTTACATECSASLCDQTNPAAPDAACDACIQANGNTCQADVSAACSADPDCIAFDTCVGDSQCSTKPDN